MLLLTTSVSAQEISSYILSMSWSPTYCLNTNKYPNTMQCNAQADHRLILHGLWPQYDSGYPSYCKTSFNKPTQSEIEGILDVTPAPGLVQHEWRKHGTCTGMSVRQYFENAEKAFNRFNLPDTLLRDNSYFTPYVLKRTVAKANPHMPPDSFYLICEKRLLKEIRVCLDNNLDPRSCPTKKNTCNSLIIKAPAPP